ncbi:hypothetical protein DL96DRAFT_1576305 [Flagelloscypha sp. PMI_526]|nr:hypothetical protein DL96DRAFT_1576305 [Flagelloscypha sp. PMI_526]
MGSTVNLITEDVMRREVDGCHLHSNATSCVTEITTRRKRTPKVGSAHSEHQVDSDRKARRSKGRRGLLWKLMNDAPLDVVLEVFAHMSLPDLLALSRSSKDLRSLLLDKTLSGQEWPKKPEEMSEPLFASILFDKTCMNCGTNHKSWPSLFYDRCLCLLCFQKDIIYWNQGPRVLQGLRGPETETLPQPLPYFSAMASRREVLLLLDRYDELKEQSQDLRISWLEQQVNSKTIKEQFTRDCVLCNVEERRKDQADWRKQRFDQPGKDFRALKCINRPQVLIDRHWAKICGELVAFMEAAKESNHRVRNLENRKYRLEILSAARNRYRETASSDLLIPPLKTIAVLPQFAEIIEQNILEAAFPEDAFDALFDESFPSFCNEWLEGELSSLYPDDTGGATMSVQLRLAAKDIVCLNGCSLAWSESQLPNSLYHKCFQYYRDIQPETLSVQDRIYAALGVRGTALQARTDPNAYEFVLLCGLDPNSTTREEIMQLNPLFLCVQCRVEPFQGQRNEMVLNFPGAVRMLWFRLSATSFI